MTTRGQAGQKGPVEGKMERGPARPPLQAIASKLLQTPKQFAKSPSELPLEELTTQYVDRLENEVLAERGYRVASMRKIGKGGFGTVFKIERGERVLALKTYLPKRAESSPAKNEIFIMKNAEHENIVRLVDSFQIGGTFYFTMEYIDGGSLGDLIKDNNHRPLSESETKPIFSQLLTAVEHLHRMGFAHRDIKLENVLLTRPPRKVKLADFGMSRKGYIENVGLRKTVEWGGTEIYMAPEIIRVKIRQSDPRKYVTFPVDLYAMGVVLFILLQRKAPIDCRQGNERLTAEQRQESYNLMRKRIYGYRRDVTLTPAAHDLILGLLEPVPIRRFTAFAALHHEWLHKEPSMKSSAMKSSARS